MGGSIKGIARGYYNTRPKPKPDLTFQIIKKLRSSIILNKEEFIYYKRFRPEYWSYLISNY